LKEMMVDAGIPFPWIGSPSPWLGFPSLVPTTVSASMGQAVPMSGLSVPAAWTAAAGAPGPGATGQPTARARVATAALSSSGRTSLNEMAMAGAAGLGVTAGMDSDRQGAATTPRRRTRSAAANGTQLQIAAELRELIDLHDAGILTEKEFAKEKGRLE